METKEKVCIAVEIASELAMGAAISILQRKFVDPHLSKGEKILVDIGTMPAAWMLGRSFAKMWYKFCDAAFDTDFEDVIECL